MSWSVILGFSCLPAEDDWVPLFVWANRLLAAPPDTTTSKATISRFLYMPSFSSLVVLDSQQELTTQHQRDAADYTESSEVKPKYLSQSDLRDGAKYALVFPRIFSLFLFFAGGTNTRLPRH